jgi:hypothetical protein
MARRWGVLAALALLARAPCCGGHGDGQGLLELLTPTQANWTVVKWGLYFGLQACATSVMGALVPLVPGDKLCGPAFKGNYSGTILTVPDFFYALDEVRLPSGVVIGVHSAGCTKEEIFIKLVATGARAVVALSDDRVSTGEYAHGAADHDPAVFNKIMLVATPAGPVLTTMTPLWAAMAQTGTPPLARVNCGDGANPMDPFLIAMSVAGLLIGLAEISVGLRGLWGAMRMAWLSLIQLDRGNEEGKADAPCDLLCLACPCCPAERARASESSAGAPVRPSSFRGPSRRRSSSIRDRQRSETMQGQALVLAIVATLRLAVGLARFFGLINIYTHSYVLGDQLAFFEAKAFFLTGLAGLTMWTIFVVAIFWLEMNDSLKELRSPKNIFKSRRPALIVGFVVFVTPDIVNSSIAASNEGAWGEPVLWTYTVLTALIAVFFIFSVRRLLNDVKGHVNKTQLDHAPDSPVRVFAIYMSRWLLVFAFATALLVLDLIVFLPTDLFRTSRYALVIMFVLLWLFTMINALSLVEGLLGPRSYRSARSRASSLASVRGQAVAERDAEQDRRKLLLRAGSSLPGTASGRAGATTGSAPNMQRAGPSLVLLQEVELSGLTSGGDNGGGDDEQDDDGYKDDIRGGARPSHSDHDPLSGKSVDTDAALVAA